MWLDRLKELKKQTGMSDKQIAEKALTSEKTIHRIFNGDNDNPRFDTLDRVARALGSTIEYICSDSNVVIGDTTLATLQENINVISAERDLILAEKAILQDKLSALEAEVNLLKLELKHKDEIISLHNYYNKLKSTDI